LSSVPSSALFFDRIDDYINLSYSPSLNITNGITITAWINSSNLSDNRIVSKDDISTIRSWSFGIYQNKLVFELWNEAGVLSTLYYPDLNTTLSTYTNYFVAVTYNPTDGPKIFVGSKTATVAEVSYDAGFPVVGSGTTTDESAGSMIQGANIDFDTFLGGLLAICGYENDDYTLGLLKNTQFRPEKYSTTVGFWNPGFNGTTNVPDWAGNSNTGTITGATVAAHVPLGLPFEI